MRAMSHGFTHTRLLLLSVHAAAAYTVTWRIETTQSTQVSGPFREWFENDDAALSSVIRSSKSISEVEELPGGLIRGRSSQSSFPFVTLEPLFTFAVTRDSEGAVVTELVEQELQVSGPGWLCKIVLAASKGMQTRSTTSVRCSGAEDDAGGSSVDLQVVSETEIDMAIPSWIPIPAEKIRQGGQASMVKQIEGDLQDMLAALADSGPPDPMAEAAAGTGGATML